MITGLSLPCRGRLICGRRVKSMQEKSIFDRFRDWLRRLLETLFSRDILEQIGMSMRGEDPEGGSAPADGISGEKDARQEMTEQERKRMMESPFERRHILFYGRVQGVGFRYHAMNGARLFGLTGWVSNLSDGSVEMEVQGPSEAIDCMLRELGSGRWIRVESMDTRMIPVVRDERGFHVRGY